MKKFLALATVIALSVGAAGCVFDTGNTALDASLSATQAAVGAAIEKGVTAALANPSVLPCLAATVSGAVGQGVPSSANTASTNAASDLCKRLSVSQ